MSARKMAFYQEFARSGHFQLNSHQRNPEANVNSNEESFNGEQDQVVNLIHFLDEQLNLQNIREEKCKSEPAKNHVGNCKQSVGSETASRKRTEVGRL